MFFLLENLRFNAGEEKMIRSSQKRLASLLGDFYINDASLRFRTVRTHRSSPLRNISPCYAGLGLEKEISSLSRIMKTPKHPLVFIVGGAKAADKPDVITYFQKKGGLVFTLAAARRTRSCISTVWTLKNHYAIWIPVT